MGDSGGVLFEGFLDGSYDCVDRVVLRAYFQLGQRAPRFRMWWRRWQGSDEELNNTRLMRVAGRFARRVKGWAKGAGVPVVYSKGGERNEDLARGYLPDEAGDEGVFVVIVGRAPGNVWDVEHTGRRADPADQAQGAEVVGEPLRLPHHGPRLGPHDRPLLPAPAVQRAGDPERP